MIKALFVALAALCLCSCRTDMSNEQSGLATAKTPSEVAAALGMGWNLGNQLEAWSADSDGREIPNDTAWFNPPVKAELFTKIASLGIKTVRIPTTWLDEVGTAPDYKINPQRLDHVASIVDMARSAGLNVIINIHHDGADSQHWLSIKAAASEGDSASQAEADKKIRQQLSSMWSQIAVRLKDYDESLIFETMNEIHDGGWGWGANRNDGGRQYEVLNQWQQVCVDAIRSAGGVNSRRWIAVQGYVCNPELTMQYLRLPADSVGRTIVSVHFYDPFEYVLNDVYEQWGNRADTTKKEKWGDEDNITNMFSRLKSTFVDKGIPVYIGEVGCVNRKSEVGASFRRYYLEYLCKAAKTYCLAPIFWDNGYTGTGREQSGLIDRQSLVSVRDGEDVLRLMVNTVENNDSAYTLQNVYDRCPLCYKLSQLENMSYD